MSKWRILQHMYVPTSMNMSKRIDFYKVLDRQIGNVIKMSEDKMKADLQTQNSSHNIKVKNGLAKILVIV